MAVNFFFITDSIQFHADLFYEFMMIRIWFKLRQNDVDFTGSGFDSIPARPFALFKRK